MSRYLLKFGFGGVQDFIAQARKMRDIAAGSWIISEMSHAAARKADSHGARLLLPTLPLESPAHWPHQLLLHFEEQEVTLRDLATQMNERAFATWKEAFESAREQAVKQGFQNYFIDDRQMELGQLSSTFDTFWIAVECEAADENFPKSYSRLSRLFDHRRHTRTFEQLPVFLDPARHEHRTCVICGVRAAIFQPKNRSDDDNLCAACVVKRFHPVPRSLISELGSTHRLARNRFLHATRFKSLRDDLFGHVPKGTNSDQLVGSVLDQLDDPASLKSITLKAENSSVKNAEEMFYPKGRPVEILEEVLGLAYYAIVVYDGDKMGKWLSGEYFAAEADLATCQSQLSATLFQFASTLADKAAALRAAIVYAGGDEGLVFCPLDSILPFLALIQSEWEKARSELLEMLGTDLLYSSPAPTLTAHASIVHAKEPLQPVIRELHKHLATAKERLDGNCFSILAHPRSGAEAHMLAPWEDLSAYISFIESLSNWRSEDVYRFGSTGSLPQHDQLLPHSFVRSILDRTDALFWSGPGSVSSDKPGRFLEDPEPFLKTLAMETSRVLDDQVAAQCKEALSWMERRAGIFEGKLRHYREPQVRSSTPSKLHAHEALATSVAVALFMASELRWKDGSVLS